jgi:hypothetical protein
MDTVITIAICLIILFFFIDGIRRGLVRQIFEIAGLIAAFIGAYYLGHAFAQRFIGSTRISYAVVRFFFSAVVFIVIALVFHLLALFGAVKGVLFVSLVCVLLFSIPAPGGLTARIRENRVAAAIYPVLPRVYNFFMKRSSAPIDSSDFVISDDFVRVQPPRGTL